MGFLKRVWSGIVRIRSGCRDGRRQKAFNARYLQAWLEYEKVLLPFQRILKRQNSQLRGIVKHYDRRDPVYRAYEDKGKEQIETWSRSTHAEFQLLGRRWSALYEFYFGDGLSLPPSLWPAAPHVRSRTSSG